MGILTTLKALFTKKEDSEYTQYARVIKRMGYKMDVDGGFIKEGSQGRTSIWIQGEGIKIKVYGGGYAESDFLRYPIDDMEKLKQFIRSNQLKINGFVMVFGAGMRRQPCGWLSCALVLLDYEFCDG